MVDMVISELAVLARPVLLPYTGLVSFSRASAGGRRSTRHLTSIGTNFMYCIKIVIGDAK
ncbi:MAG: hypothetical protein B7Z50_04815 [Sphingomonadales bacterium 12-62-5]|nr:MAG: hypothetical protein B7Z50_04815 [Sphingomonadales bacterium 12-62-5]